MMRGVASLPVAWICLTGLAGCSPQECNPSQAGFFKGIGCQAGGGYAVRNAEQQQALAAARAQALQERANAVQTGADAQQAEALRAANRRRSAALDAETDDLVKQLAAARQHRAADQATLARAQKELDALQHTRATLAPDATEAQLKELEQRRRAVADILVQM